MSTDSYTARSKDKNIPIQLTVKEWSSGERLKRALKLLAKSWGVALAAVFIPLLHFFLVPLFVLGGLIGAALVYGAEKSLEKGEGTCPSCGAPVSVAKRWNLVFPFAFHCENCQARIEVDFERV